jgi:hypothetical protein
MSDAKEAQLGPKPQLVITSVDTSSANYVSRTHRGLQGPCQGQSGAVKDMMEPRLNEHIYVGVSVVNKANLQCPT